MANNTRLNWCCALLGIAAVVACMATPSRTITPCIDDFTNSTHTTISQTQTHCTIAGLALLAAFVGLLMICCHCCVIWEKHRLTALVKQPMANVNDYDVPEIPANQTQWVLPLLNGTKTVARQTDWGYRLGPSFFAHTTNAQPTRKISWP